MEITRVKTKRAAKAKRRTQPQEVKGAGQEVPHARSERVACWPTPRKAELWGSCRGKAMAGIATGVIATERRGGQTPRAGKGCEACEVG